MLYLCIPLGNLQEYFFSLSNRCSLPATPIFLLFLTILDGNICTTYFIPYKFIQCIIQKIMAWFSKESCLIKNINYYRMLSNSFGNCHGLGKWAGWLDFHYIVEQLYHSSSLILSFTSFLYQLFSRLLAWTLASASPRSSQKCRILDLSPEQLN